MGLMFKIFAIIATISVTGCATTQQSQNPVGTAIIAHNTVKNAQQLTGESVRAETQQILKNLLRNYNRSQGGF